MLLFLIGLPEATVNKMGEWMPNAGFAKRRKAIADEEKFQKDIAAARIKADENLRLQQANAKTAADLKRKKMH